MKWLPRLGGSACLGAAAVAVGYGREWPVEEKKAADDKRRSEQEARARSLVQRCMATKGIPGLSIAVSVNGRTQWAEGFGMADIETGARCHKNTMMRIASISKPITSTLAAIAVDGGYLDLDAPIQKYLPDFPVKKWNNNPTIITTRMLLSHTSGIRHYKKKGEPQVNGDGNAAKTSEFYSNKAYANTTEAVKMFADDELVVEPGTYQYTTHGFTLVAAILEKVTGDGAISFERQIDMLVRRLGMRNTRLDRNATIINDRAKYYLRNAKGELENTPEVDNSYKWAGGGILSTAPDLTIFGNAVLYSQQQKPGSISSPPALISPETCAVFWKGEIGIGPYAASALGWARIDVPPGGPVGGAPEASSYGGYWCHTGGAVGASSALLLVPSSSPSSSIQPGCPNGVVVAILVNLQSTSVLTLAIEIAELFREQ